MNPHDFITHHWWWWPIGSAISLAISAYIIARHDLSEDHSIPLIAAGILWPVALVLVSVAGPLLGMWTISFRLGSRHFESDERKREAIKKLRK